MRFVTSLALVLCLGTLASAQVVINEFVYDDSGGDDREFVELYNSSALTVDISNWTVENVDDGGPNTGSPVVIPMGTMLASGAFFVIGDAAVPNVDLMMASGWLQNSKEAIVLSDAGATIIDTVAYETNKTTMLAPQFIEGVGIWGNHFSSDGSMLSLSRWLDGQDTDDNGADFGQLPMTPGASNNIATPLNVSEDFDALAVESLLAGWHASFVVPTVVDPTTASASLPNAVSSASPQGGNAIVAWDSSGGGNAAFLTAVPEAEMAVEAWVWFSTFVHDAGEQEQWSIGISGSTGPFYNLPIGFTANGNTGVAWNYRIDDTGIGTLELTDEGGGGAPNTVLATIGVQAGMNDGWQRLRLELSGGNIKAHFGGPFGNPNIGLVGVFPTSTTGPGQLYLGYREAVTGTTNAQPLMLDNLQVSPATAAECWMLASFAQTAILVGPDISDVLLVAYNPAWQWETTIQNVPTWPIPNDPNLLGLTFYTQVVMWNPDVFPNDPLQLSNGLEFIIGGGVNRYGPQTTINLFPTQYPLLGGSIQMGFTIQGF